MTECRYFAYPSDDGHALFGRQWGAPGEGLPLVCLPGLTRSSTDFEALAEALAQRGRHVVALDFRGRGGSAFAPVSTYAVPQEALDTVRGLSGLGITRAHFLGTSRGGLVMMMLGLIQPDLMASCIFNDIGPVVEAAGIARITDYVGVAPPPSWPELVLRLKREQGALFPALTAAEWERYARQIHMDDGGRPRLAYDPAMAEAFKAFDPTKPLPTFWEGFDALEGRPMLVIHGARSDVLGSATVAAMAARHAGLEVHTVEDQGHAPLLWDAPAQTVIADFLERAAPRC